MTQRSIAERADTPAGTGTGTESVVVLLGEQHEAIEELFGAVRRATGAERAATFRALVRVLAMHETAEEQITHPALRRLGGAGESIARARVDEENEAKRALTDLEEMGTDDPRFPHRFERLEADVRAHAEREESEEFPILAERHDEATLAMMGRALRAVEAVLPARPYPSTDSATNDLLAAPVVAVVDRVRDGVRRAGTG